jgi:hypothetical protein
MVPKNQLYLNPNLLYVTASYHLSVECFNPITGCPHFAMFQACDITGGDIKEEHGALPAETVKREAACTIAFMESGAWE